MPAVKAWLDLRFQIFLQFLLDYPLGVKRLEHHLQFLVANLSYPHDTGRVSVLTLLNAVGATSFLPVARLYFPCRPVPPFFLHAVHDQRS